MTAPDSLAVIEECAKHIPISRADTPWRAEYLAALASLKREREALRDLMSTIDLVCDTDAQAKGYDVLSPYARSALELSLGRARAALDGEQETKT